MAFADLFRKLFGPAQEPVEETVPYKDYRIRPAPKAEDGRYYIAGYIGKTFPDGDKEQYFVRADSFTSREDAVTHTLLKAERIIEDQGDRLFQG